MLEVIKYVAALSATLFAGASIYINLVEHPSRLGLETSIAATQWAPSYQRATWMQAPLALVSFVAGVAAWLLDAGGLWLVAALLIGAVVPFTFVVIMPTNRALLAPGRDLASEETRDLLVHWGRLHGVRSVLSLVSSLLFLVLLRRVA